MDGNEMQIILNFIKQITNPDNEIRSAAEGGINALYSQNPIVFFNIIFDIINSNPMQKESFLCVLVVKQYLTNENLMYYNQSFPDILLILKNRFLSFACDERFPLELNEIILFHILFKLYFFSKFLENGFFTDFVPFLVTLLDSKFRSNSLEILCSPAIFSELEEIYKSIQQKCDLFSSDFDYRSKSFCFCLNCIKFDPSNFIIFYNSICEKITDIFNDMPDEQLCSCFLTLLYINQENGTCSTVLYRDFFMIIGSRLESQERDETRKITFVHYITEMFSSTLFYKFICSDEISYRFFYLIQNLASDPIQFPGLYFECRKLIKFIYANYLENEQMIKSDPERIRFYALFRNMADSNNPFVSSLFLMNFCSPENLGKSIEFIRFDDSSFPAAEIRRNGLSLLNKIILGYHEIMDDAMCRQLFEFLFNLYQIYQNDKFLKVLTNLSCYLSSELISEKRNDIISLCQKCISKDLICCASYFCLDDSADSVELAKFLFHKTIELMEICPEDSVLAYVISSLSQIITTAGPEVTFSFINKVIPNILEDPKCFSNKYLPRFIICIGNGQIKGELSKNILLQLMKFIENTSQDDLEIPENISNLCFSMKRIPFYADMTPNFEEELLEHSISILKQRIKEQNFNIRGKAIVSISNLSKYYCKNSDMLGEIFETLKGLFLIEKNIYIIRCLLLLFQRTFISIQEYFDEKNLSVQQNMITFYPCLFGQTYDVITSYQNGDKVIDRYTSNDFVESIKLLITLFNLFLGFNQKMTVDLVIDFFLRETYDQNEFKFGSKIFSSYFIYLWSAFLEIVDISLYSNELPKIIHYLLDDFLIINVDDIFNQALDYTRCIKTLTSFFSKSDVPNDVVNKFAWEKLVPLINLRNDIVIENQSAMQDLMNNAISALIILSFKYTDTINFPDLISIIADNLCLLVKSNCLTFSCFFRLILICLSNNKIDLAKTFLAKIFDIIQSNSVEDAALCWIFNEFRTNSEIPPIFDPIRQLVFQIKHQ